MSSRNRKAPGVRVKTRTKTHWSEKTGVSYLWPGLTPYARANYWTGGGSKNTPRPKHSKKVRVGWERKSAYSRGNEKVHTARAMPAVTSTRRYWERSGKLGALPASSARGPQTSSCRPSCALPASLSYLKGLFSCREISRDCLPNSVSERLKRETTER